MLRITLAAAVALGAATTVRAYDDEIEGLTVGDKAPAIELTHWLRGDQINEFETGKVYVLEFWATWCGPCRASIPHISELQAQYEDYDVTFIGVSDEGLQTVVEFLCKADRQGTIWNDKMQYTVAADPDRSAYIDYMLSAGMSGIPTAFVIGKDRRIEWIGHPTKIDEPLGAIVRDTWDRDAFKAEWEPKMAPRRAELRPRLKLERAKMHRDWPAVLTSLDELIALNENDSRYKVSKFLVYVRDMNQPKTGYAYGRQLIDEYWDKPRTLNQIAWYTVDKEGIQSRDLEFAMKAAGRANELTKEKDPAILDTLARVYYEMGDLEQAIKCQQKAVDEAAGTRSADGLAETLSGYEAAAGKK